MMECDPLALFDVPNEHLKGGGVEFSSVADDAMKGNNSPDDYSSDSNDSIYDDHTVESNTSSSKNSPDSWKGVDLTGIDFEDHAQREEDVQKGVQNQLPHITEPMNMTTQDLKDPDQFFKNILKPSLESIHDLENIVPGEATFLEKQKKILKDKIEQFLKYHKDDPAIYTALLEHLPDYQDRDELAMHHPYVDVVRKFIQETSSVRSCSDKIDKLSLLIPVFEETRVNTLQQALRQLIISEDNTTASDKVISFVKYMKQTSPFKFMPDDTKNELVKSFAETLRKIIDDCKKEPAIQSPLAETMSRSGSSLLSIDPSPDSQDGEARSANSEVSGTDSQNGEENSPGISESSSQHEVYSSVNDRSDPDHDITYNDDEDSITNQLEKMVQDNVENVEQCTLKKNSFGDDVKYSPSYKDYKTCAVEKITNFMDQINHKDFKSKLNKKENDNLEFLIMAAHGLKETLQKMDGDPCPAIYEYVRHETNRIHNYSESIQKVSRHLNKILVNICTYYKKPQNQDPDEHSDEPGDRSDESQSQSQIDEPSDDVSTHTSPTDMSPQMDADTETLEKISKEHEAIVSKLNQQIDEGRELNKAQLKELDQKKFDLEVYKNKLSEMKMNQDLVRQTGREQDRERIQQLQLANDIYGSFNREDQQLRNKNIELIKQNRLQQQQIKHQQEEISKLGQEHGRRQIALEDVLKIQTTLQQQKDKLERKLSDLQFDVEQETKRQADMSKNDITTIRHLQSDNEEQENTIQELTSRLERTNQQMMLIRNNRNVVNAEKSQLVVEITQMYEQLKKMR